METSQLALNYENWDIFGQQPSLNHNFNMIVNFRDALQTPFFYDGEYEQYYCLIDRSMSYGRFKF